MTPQDFITQWGAPDGVPGPAYGLNEEQGAQSHFLDLCELLGVPKPGSADGYRFEEKSAVIGGKTGYADVFKRGVFAWENKAPGKNLDTALKQLLTYSLALSNPPILVVSDRLTIRIHTQFTGHPSQTHSVSLYELDQPDKQALLRRIWTAPESFKPTETNRDITEAAAKSFATLAEGLRRRGITTDAQGQANRVAHFLTQCLFCFFAEDVGLLPGRMFERLVNNRHITPAKLSQGLADLFAAMAQGGMFGADDIPWFNGGLFKRIDVPTLSILDVTELRNAANLNWSAIDVSIFGTLFERGLDPAKRSQLGAHYTDTATIDRIIDPVLRRPLLQKWQQVAQEIQGLQAKSTKKGDKNYRAAKACFIGWLDTLQNYRILDPACGSGNFLFLGLKALKDIEHKSHLDAAALGLDREADLVTGPHNVLGIELNEYAAELARVTVWIGELQWRMAHGYEFKTNPVLEPLDHIECRDALLCFPDAVSDGEDAASEEAGCEPGARAAQRPQPHTRCFLKSAATSAPPAPLSDNGSPSVTEATWPTANVVIGNPPFLGDRKMIRELGEDYTFTLRRVYQGRVPGGADLVCYWFEKARLAIERDGLQAAGLVSTNSIRGGANRKVLDAICQSTRIFDAWSDEGWVNDGAAVRVPLIAFGDKAQIARLDNVAVTAISADLTEQDLSGLNDLTGAAKLPENTSASFIGTQKNGPFDITGQLAREWLRQPNPNGLSNAKVLRPWVNGIAVTRRSEDLWVIDFDKMSEADACLFELPFAKAIREVKPTRLELRRDWHRLHWWCHGDPRPSMKLALRDLPRQIISPRVSKHRVFAWFSSAVLADSAVVAITRADDTTFGILHSRFHELWSLRMCTWLGVGNDPRYTPTTCFETFPFPAGLTPADTAHQRTETLPGGALIPADLYKENQPLALMNQGQVATNTILTLANGVDPSSTSKARVVRRSGAILKSNAYEPPASEPAAPGESPQTVAHHNTSPATSKSSTKVSAPLGLRDHAIAIAQAAKKLNDLREAWLNPPEWTHRVPEVIPLGLDHSPYPDRIEPRPGISDADLKALHKRTLTNLYNAKPAWLTLAHQQLDLAVAAAYGWADYSPALPDDEILKRLLALNLARSGGDAASGKLTQSASVADVAHDV
ncbi:class I SAM-dependent DNA methyltransferase [Rhodoferax sp. BLA1]|uniref:class I SAM-dependent DNA methyltransferase n=1 Tax=Rhodoferax sp. BLA1 TaxID=2576062 RepID=UPI0015D0D9AC|nr:class I SAM-dependent DNA methyltransferase [Rhodoferax sp. BLA1]